MSDDILEWLIEYTEYDADPSHRNKLKEAARKLEALRAENAQLREALKPFADEVQHVVPDAPDSTYWDDITVGMLRAARAAMGDEE